MAYELLSEPIRKYIRDKRWESLRPIQAAAITRIIETDNNYILASKTASGKTEAAFLPILSKTNFNDQGVQVLYISPLIALINDQFLRIEDLCQGLEITVTKWHGEANRTLKKALLNTPNGIVLITPESIEAMFVNNAYNLKKLFGNLQYIVIDEIHSFLGNDRGLQLASLLSRLRQINAKKCITIGLSATIGDDNYIEVKKLIGDIDKTKVLLDRGKKETIAKFKFFKNDKVELPLSLIKELYKETSNHKVLIFPNSRAKTEEISVKLKKIATIVGGHQNYYSHHSSIDKEIREDIEHFAKNNERFNFGIACTSTLELGIDIGSVDKIIQIDSTHSVASLVQRIGRSGRRTGEKSIVGMYTTDKWSLLQSFASWLLYKKDFLEPITTAKKPFDILLHQILSIIKETSGTTLQILIHKISLNTTFQHIEQNEFNQLISYLKEKEYLELIRNELIIGIEGEKIVNSREFYSVFKTEQNFKVIASGRKIGEIPYSPQVIPNENILLAAKVWKIKDIDLEAKKILVKPANDGKRPMFFGNGGDIHPMIRFEMLNILKSSEQYDELDTECMKIIHELRFDFKNYTPENLNLERPLIQKDSKTILFTFTGTKINKTLNLLFGLIEIESFINEKESSIEINASANDLSLIFKKIINQKSNIEDYLNDLLMEDKTLISFSKWGTYLPIKLQIEIIKERLFDFEGAFYFIENIKLKSID